MTSTFTKKDQHQPSPVLERGRYSRNGQVVLGSDGSEMSSAGDGEGQLPDSVDIQVVLPDQQTQSLTVDYGKQMMDLLVQVTTSHHLSPATHTFKLYSEETGRPVEYHASQTVGSLGIQTLHLTQKKAKVQKKKTKEQLLQQQQQSGGTQPFEITQRLTVNLPKNQKMISRVSPKVTLADIFKMVCSEKNLDPYKYELRHPFKADEALNMARPLRDYQLAEISVVPIGPDVRHHHLSLDSCDLTESISTSTTLPRPLSSTVSSSSVDAYRSATMEKKKKKGFFSIFSKKKEGKLKISDAKYSESASSLPSSSQINSYPASTSSLKRDREPRPPSSHDSRESLDASSGNSVRDSTPQDTGNRGQPHHPPPKPPRKKRQAPPPPTQNNITSSSVTPPPSVQQVTALHSRHSSHSSGFESAGSPIESPGPNRPAVVTETVDSVRAAPQTDRSVRPKEPKSSGTGEDKKKKRMAPAPPGVSRLRVSSESSEATASTTGSVTRQEEDQTTTQGEISPLEQLIDSQFDFVGQDDNNDDDDTVDLEDNGGVNGYNGEGREEVRGVNSSEGLDLGSNPQVGDGGDMTLGYESNNNFERSTFKPEDSSRAQDFHKVELIY